jgi:hypothetical protein
MEVLYKKVIKKYSTVECHDYCDIENTNHRKENNNFYTKTNDGKRLIVSIKDKFKSEDKFEENFGNPLAHVECLIHTLVIEQDENKISLKLFYNFKKRIPLQKFFVKRRKVMFMTIKKDTGNVYTGTKHMTKKDARLNTLRCNPFNTRIIDTILHEIRSVFNEEYLLVAKDINEYSVIKSIKNIIFDELGIDKKHLFTDGIFLNRMEKIGVRVSDNFKVFLTKESNIIPTARIYKKVKGNFIDGIMLVNKLKGKKIKRVLHKLTHFNVFMYKYMLSLFGEKYIKSQSDDDLVNIFQSGVWYRLSADDSDYDVEILKNMSDDERERVWLVAMLVCTGHLNSTTFVDHIKYYFKLKGYGEEVKWKSFDMTTFVDEHEDFANRVSEYTQGTVTRVYDPKVISIIEDTIVSFDGGTYFPVILKSSREYVNESSVQHNCVRTYQKHETILVSIRDGDVNSEERASVEFKLQPNASNKVVIIQNLGKYNQPLDRKWDFAIETVLNRFKLLVPELMNTKLIFNTKFSETIYNYEYLGQGMNLSWSSTVNGEKKYLTDNNNVGLLENLF